MVTLDQEKMGDSGTKQDPVGLLCTEAFLCPQFLVGMEQVSASMKPSVPKDRFKQ